MSVLAKSIYPFLEKLTAFRFGVVLVVIMIALLIYFLSVYLFSLFSPIGLKLKLSAQDVLSLKEWALFTLFAFLSGGLSCLFVVVIFKLFRLE